VTQLAHCQVWFFIDCDSLFDAFDPGLEVAHFTFS
jgi:hypothetical protein